jgi:hypothetical protein
MPSEFADTARFYNELGAQMSDIKTQREEVKDRLKSYMVQADAREGRCGEYVLERVIRKIPGYTVKPRTDEILKVTKAKEG